MFYLALFAAVDCNIKKKKNYINKLQKLPTKVVFPRNERCLEFQTEFVSVA